MSQSQRIGSLVVGSLTTGTLGGQTSSVLPSSFPGISGSTSMLVPHKGGIAPFEGQNDAECTGNYFPRPWKTGLEKDLNRRQLLFVRQPDADNIAPSSTSILNLGQLNHKLREQGEKAEAILKAYAGSNTLVAELNSIPESLWEWDKYKEIFSSLDTASLAYISPPICAKLIKVLGVLNQPATDTERRRNNPNNRTISSKSSGGPPINVCVSKKAHVCNYWERVSVGDSLWLVLRRVKNTKTNKYTPGLRYVPVITQGKYPSKYQRAYETRLGIMEQGLCFYIGVVQSIDNVKTLTEQYYREASGLLGTYDKQKNAQINNGYIKIQLSSGVGVNFK